MNKNRQIVILEKLLQEENCTIKQLSLLCDVSYKTIQSDIRNINSLFMQYGKQSHIVTQSGRGVQLNPCLTKEINQLISELVERDHNLLQTDKEYDYLQLSMSLIRNEYSKIDDLCEQLSLSRSAVNLLITECKQRFQPYDIVIKSRPYYGLYLVASEKEIRRFLFDLLYSKRHVEITTLLQMDAQNTISLYEHVVVLIKNYELSIHEETLEQLLLHIQIMTSRIITGCVMPFTEETMEKSSLEGILSEKIAMQISECFSVQIADTEIYWIYCFLIGKCHSEQERQGVLNNAMLEDTWHCVITMIQEKYGYDFNHDIDLYTSMVIHLASLFKRARVENYSVNPMLNDIKTYSLLAYDMAVDTAFLINNMLHVTLPDDEISYFAIYLHLAIERKKQQTIPKRALAVCPTGKGMAELIAHDIKKQFKEYISVLDTCGYYDLDNIDFNNYDYIFTIKPLKQRVPLPVIEFSLLKNKENMNKAKMQIQGIQPDNLPLICLTPRELFFNDIKATDKYDVLKQMTDKIAQVIHLEHNFLDSVIERENVVSTELNYGFAIPHPIGRNMAEYSFFAIAVLNSPVLWNKKKIRIVLLSFIKGNEASDFERFYESFATLVSEKEYAISLLEKPTYENLVEIAKQIALII